MRKRKQTAGLLVSVLLAVLVLAGCGEKMQKKNAGKDNVLADNIIITETGEVLEKKETEETLKPETEKPGFQEPEQTLSPEETEQGKNAVVTVQAEDGTLKEVELREPEQEQVVTQDDQIEPANRGLQLVFLGDSIFDGSRDGTGIPFLTAEQCDADVYNLAIGGTSATIELGEPGEDEKWTSRSLCGVVKAITKKIPTDIFAGTRAKEIMDNPNIDFSKTDYFIVEYGTNDFFRGVPQSSGDYFDLMTYAGALRYAVCNLRDCAPDATIILCSPCYAQFFDGNWMIGDGNVTNTGNGTLFDYKGTCNYVANEFDTLFFNAYQDLGINGYTAEEYLEDGVHLTEKGRKLYADNLAHMILEYEETKNN